MENFEAFRQVISSSINLLFLKSDMLCSCNFCDKIDGGSWTHGHKMSSILHCYVYTSYIYILAPTNIWNSQESYELQRVLVMYIALEDSKITYSV